MSSPPRVVIPGSSPNTAALEYIPPPLPFNGDPVGIHDFVYAIRAYFVGLTAIGATLSDTAKIAKILNLLHGSANTWGSAWLDMPISTWPSFDEFMSELGLQFGLEISTKDAKLEFKRLTREPSQSVPEFITRIRDLNK